MIEQKVLCDSGVGANSEGVGSTLPPPFLSAAICGTSPSTPACGKDGVEAEREVSGIVLQTRGTVFRFLCYRTSPPFINIYRTNSLVRVPKCGGW